MALKFLTVVLVTLIAQVKSHTEFRGCRREPQAPYHGYVKSGGNHVGAIRGIECYANYELIGQSFMRCLSSGEWSSPGVCSYKYDYTGNTEECRREPQAPYNGYVDKGVSQTGSVRRVGCFADYKLVGQEFVFCLSNGQWSLPGVCVSKDEGTPNATACSTNPPSPNNGYVEQAGGNHKGALRHIGCFPDHMLVGQPYVICLSTGQWTPPGNCTYQAPEVIADTGNKMQSPMHWLITFFVTTLFFMFNSS